jgi:circadian clock protein KaiC
METAEPITETGAAPVKVRTGIEGFDEISRGGLPVGRTTLIMGTPGAGKTVFALQTLVSAARTEREAGIFVAFEEKSQQIIANAGAFGWNIPELQAQKLFFLDAKMSPEIIQSGGFDIAGMLKALEVKARELKARRIVFDGIDVLLTLLDDPVMERREIFRLHEWLVENELSGILTVKSTFEEPLSTGRWGFMQYMADCVVLLHNRVIERVALRGVRILKYRGSPFAANEYPLVIGPNGVEVATFGPDSLDFEVSDERVPSGVALLDDMLGGGYFRGSSVLVTGAPGTAKTTLSGAFAASTCGRGERALYVSFDEPATQIVRNLTSVGLDLQRCRDEGLLRMYAVRTEVRSAEEHLVVLDRLIRTFDPHALIIDPISALTKSGGALAAADTAVRLLDLARSRGTTALCTSLVGGPGTAEEATELQISTIADTWLHVAYVLQGGERNRALSIVKSRGMAHSNQVRELVLGAEGITLRDVYVEGGDVLMGTARFEKEAETRAQQERARIVAGQRRAELEQQRAELEARMASLRSQLSAHEYEIARLDEEQRSSELHDIETRAAIRRLRGGAVLDAEGGGNGRE